MTRLPRQRQKRESRGAQRFRRGHGVSPLLLLKAQRSCACLMAVRRRRCEAASARIVAIVCLKSSRRGAQPMRGGVPQMKSSYLKRSRSAGEHSSAAREVDKGTASSPARICQRSCALVQRGSAGAQPMRGGPDGSPHLSLHRERSRQAEMHSSGEREVDKGTASSPAIICQRFCALDQRGSRGRSPCAGVGGCPPK
jgi:hypothetical protein